MGRNQFRDRIVIITGSINNSVQRGNKSDVDFTWDHVLHSPNCSIEKAGRALGYRPRYTSLQAVFEALTWLIEHRVVIKPPIPREGS